MYSCLRHARLRRIEDYRGNVGATLIGVNWSRFSRATDSGGLPSLVTLSAVSRSPELAKGKGLTRWGQRSFALLRMTFSVERGAQSGRPGHKVNAYGGDPYGRPVKGAGMHNTEYIEQQTEEELELT